MGNAHFAPLCPSDRRCDPLFCRLRLHRQELMTSEKPTTVYLRWPEQDLLALSPLVRFLWSSLIDSLITHYDERQGKDCNPVLLLVDEARQNRNTHARGFCDNGVGRRISLWMAVQSSRNLRQSTAKPAHRCCGTTWTASFSTDQPISRPPNTLKSA